LLHSPDRARDVTYSLFNQILSRGPTPTELSGSVASLTKGGDSDALALQLLGSRAFSARFPGNAEFVAAINRQLIPSGVSRRFVAWELELLKRGMSREALVQQVMRSVPAMRAKVTNLATLYLGSTHKSAILNGLVSAALRSKWSTDQITLKLLVSSSFARSAATTPLAKLVHPQTGQSPRYQLLSRTVSTLTGQTPGQAELDAIDQALLDGYSVPRVISRIAASPQARTFAVQTQYRNLLRREATPDELTRALEEAQCANVAAPQSALVTNILADINSRLGLGERATQFGKLAVELNPYDVTILASQATRLASLGDEAGANDLRNQIGPEFKIP
jgi:hypothetical protein